MGIVVCLQRARCSDQVCKVRLTSSQEFPVVPNRLGPPVAVDIERLPDISQQVVP